MTEWSDAIIEAISSKEEADIYRGAGLKEARIGGRPALIRQDIDWSDYSIKRNTWLRGKLVDYDKWAEYNNADLIGEGFPPRDSNGDPYEIQLRDELYFITDRYKDVFLRDVWEPEAFEDSQYSIVFLNKDLFEGFLNTLEGLKFNSCFSLILLDLDSQKVVNEVFLPRRKGRKEKSLFKLSERGDR